MYNHLPSRPSRGSCRSSRASRRRSSSRRSAPSASVRRAPRATLGRGRGRRTSLPPPTPTSDLSSALPRSPTLPPTTPDARPARPCGAHGCANDRGARRARARAPFAIAASSRPLHGLLRRALNPPRGRRHARDQAAADDPARARVRQKRRRDRRGRHGAARRDGVLRGAACVWWW